MFGEDVTDLFLKTNNLSRIIRSHEVQMHGYAVHHGGKVVTIFSAPNYCGNTNNYGAILRFDGDIDNPKIITFRAARKGYDD